MAVSRDAPAQAKAGSSFIWALVESGGLSALSLVTLLILARLVGPKELGVAALAFGVVQLLTVIVEGLLHDAVVQRPNLDKLYLDTAFWTSTLAGVVLCVACVAGAPFFADLFNEDDIVVVMRVAAGGLILSGIGAIPQAWLRRQTEFRSLAMRSIYGRLAGAIVGMVLAVAGAGVWSVVALQMVQTAAATALIWPAVKWRPSFAFCPKRARDLLAFGVPSVAGRLTWVFALRLFTILFGYYFGVVAAGYLNIAQRVVDTLYDTLAGAAYNLALPFLAHRQNDRPAFLRACRTAVEFTAVATLPIFIGLAICAPSIVGVFLGDDWMPSASLISVFALGAMAQFLFLLPNVALVASGKPGVNLLLSVVSLGYAFGALLILHPASPLGASLVWSSRIVATAPLLIFFMYRLFGQSASELLFASRAPLGAVTVMTVVLLFIQNSVLTTCSDVIRLAALVPTGGLVYAGCLFLMGRDVSQRIIEFVLAGLKSLKTS